MEVDESELRELLNEVERLRKQVTQLQQANNREVERRRAAEAKTPNKPEPEKPHDGRSTGSGDLS